ncbi:hypothetical protein [Streptomyces zaomyceticus]|uniref:hypothetical protein n=1 Tax=Streptomyces zaomyceticus TaxID=68286 RepID=UPI00167821F3|nr:hypothetical protein [Streptomyces zaomyceticus]GHF96293.1 hypothetical protein GCM10018791_03910 [Streptomyces zaomyceticus]
MTRVESGTPYGWGRLHAAFQVLEVLAVGRTVLGTPAGLRRTTNTPRNHFVELLRGAGLLLLVTREKGGDHARAVEAVFGDIVRLTGPQRMYDKSLDERQIAEFRRGHADQVAEYRKAWESIVP